MNWALTSRITRIGVTFISLAGFVLLLLPVVVIAPLSLSGDRLLDVTDMSLKWYQRMWDNPGYMLSFFNTIVTGLAVAFLSLVLGTMAALSLVRGRFRQGKAISMLLLLPLVMPQIILAIGIFPVLAKFGLIGSRLSVIIAHSVVALPLVFVAVSTSLRSYSQNIELAAMTLGANGFGTFIHVTLPMIRPGLAVGAILAFAFSFDEIILALFLTDANSVTLPVFMWNELRLQLDPTIAAASTVAIVTSLALLGVVSLLQSRNKKTGA
jgi:ABC-type spermidine/putrescine transport system permease subunit II